MKIFRKEVEPDGHIYFYLFNTKIISYIDKTIERKIVEPPIPLYNEDIISNKEGVIYKGNLEYGTCSLEQRLKETDDLLEYEDMIVTNIAIGNLYLKDIKKVVNIGAGVGTFEFNNAPKFPDTMFIASEFNESECEYSKEKRPFPNVTYCSDDMQTLINKYGKFDLAVSIDVIEHVKDYGKFLKEFVKLSDFAIISTPNRDRWRTVEELEKPPYIQHVQEWNAGEFYFLLKAFYKNVKLYSFVDPYKEDLVEVGIYSTYDKLVAVCSQ